MCSAYVSSTQILLYMDALQKYRLLVAKQLHNKVHQPVAFLYVYCITFSFLSLKKSSKCASPPEKIFKNYQ